MTATPRMAGTSVALRGSPLASYMARAAAGILGGQTLVINCPHPAEVSRIYLPSAILCCGDCDATARKALGARAPDCAACGAPAAGSAVWLWGDVLVIAHLCDRCRTTGNVAQSLN